METGKPLIAILMAVYEPRMDWLREQLQSLDTQTYPNLRLYVRDDCSPTVSFDAITECVQACIHSFPYEISRNDKNLGSNLTFERLTREAEGEYFAYCDQDDVWLPKKLEVLQKEQEASGALLVCSDMYIIDGEDRQTADSITRVRRHHKFRSGGDLAEGLLVNNFVTGCTMLVASTAAKAAVPFCPYMVHDHYIALYCAARGEVLSVLRPLIRYRIHGGNQTGLMAGVRDKKSYIEVRISIPLQKFQWLSEHFPYREQLRDALNIRTLWMHAREKYALGNRSQARIIWQYKSFSPKPSLFEIMMPFLPDSLFRLAVWAGRHNYI